MQSRRGKAGPKWGFFIESRCKRDALAAAPIALNHDHSTRDTTSGPGLLSCFYAALLSQGAAGSEPAQADSRPSEFQKVGQNS